MCCPTKCHCGECVILTFIIRTVIMLSVIYVQCLYAQRFILNVAMFSFDMLYFLMLRNENSYSTCCLPECHYPECCGTIRTWHFSSEMNIMYWQCFNKEGSTHNLHQSVEYLVQQGQANKLIKPCQSLLQYNVFCVGDVTTLSITTLSICI